MTAFKLRTSLCWKRIFVALPTMPQLLPKVVEPLHNIIFFLELAPFDRPAILPFCKIMFRRHF